MKCIDLVAVVYNSLVDFFAAHPHFPGGVCWLCNFLPDWDTSLPSKNSTSMYTMFIKLAKAQLKTTTSTLSCAQLRRRCSFHPARRTIINNAQHDERRAPSTWYFLFAHISSVLRSANKVACTVAWSRIESPSQAPLGYYCKFQSWSLL